MILHMKMRISEACCTFFYPYCKLCNKVWNYFHEWIQKQTFWIRFFFFSSPFKGMNQNDGKKLPIDLRIFDVITEIQTGWQKRLCKKRSNRYIGKIVSVPHCIFCFWNDFWDKLLHSFFVCEICRRLLF